MTEIDAEIITDKETRRDLDALLQRLKNCPPSRERALSITKLQESIMWLGMDLKRLNGMKPADPAASALDKESRARAAYHRYGQITDFKNFRGDPMPAWDELGDKIQAAWMAAITPEPSGANPYPNSYDPSNTLVEPTADGLKL